MYQASSDFLKGKSNLEPTRKRRKHEIQALQPTFPVYVDTERKNSKKIMEYIKNQLEKDRRQDLLTFREYKDLSRAASNRLLQMSDRTQANTMAVTISGLYRLRKTAGLMQ